MTYRYEPLDPESSRRDEISRFVRGSVNGTLFHQPRFVAYHDPEGLKARGIEDLCVALYKGNALIGFLPGGTKIDAGEKVFLSPYGSAYGGLVFRRGLSLENLRRLVQLVSAFLRDGGFQQARFLLSLPCFHGEPYYDTVKYLLMGVGFRVTRADLKMVVDLRRGGVKDQFHHSARKFLRQAGENGVRVRASREIDLFFRKASDYYRSRNVRVTHTPEEMARLVGWFPDDFFLFEAVVGEEALGGLLLLRVNEDSLYAMYVYLEEEAFRLRAINAVYAHVLEWMDGNGFRFLDLGTSGDGEDLNEKLLHFKETIGGWGMFRETMSWRGGC